MATKPTRRWEKPSSAAAATSAAPTEMSVDSILSGMSADDRATHRSAFLHLVQSLSGVEVDMDLTDNRTIRGVFHTATPFKGEEFKVVLKGARESKANSTSEPIEPASVVITNFDGVSTIRSGKIDLQSKAYSTEFQTDSSIKKHGDLSSLEGRTLQSINNAWLDSSFATDLTSTSKSMTWDQFETNKRLFHVKSSYDENLYTKKIDYSAVTSEQLAFAERMAREIEGQTSANIHLQEERGHVIERDIDEEDRFSGVLRATPTTPASTGSSGGAPKTAWDRGQKIGGAAAAGGGGAAAAPPKGGKAATPKATPTKTSYASAAGNASAPASSEVSPSTSGKLAPPPNLSLQGGNSTAASSSNKLPPPPALSPATKPPSISTVTTTTTVTAVSTATTVSSSPTQVTTDAVSTTTTETPAKADDAAAAPATPATETKPAAKLNANAKPFEFKASAKEFVPSFLKPPPLPVVAAEPPSTPQQQPQFVPPPAPQVVMSPPVGGVVPPPPVGGVAGVPLYPGYEGVPAVLPPGTPVAAVPQGHFKQASPHQPPMVQSPVTAAMIPPHMPAMPMPMDPYQQQMAYDMMMQQQFFHQQQMMQAGFVPVDQFGHPMPAEFYPPAGVYADPNFYPPFQQQQQAYYPQQGYSMNGGMPQGGANGQYGGGGGGGGGYHNQNGQFNKNNNDNRNSMGGRGGGGNYSRNNNYQNNRNNNYSNRGGNNSGPGTPTRHHQNNSNASNSANNSASAGTPTNVGASGTTSESPAVPVINLPTSAASNAEGYVAPASTEASAAPPAPASE